jgi:CheY-like chemotaxis protein
MAFESSVPGHRVLVVDDNRDVADMQALLLRLSGQTVQRAYDGPTALRLASEFKPEVVFVDLVMPGMDGLTLARLLRKIKGMETARIVALTAFTQTAFRDATKAAGFDGHIAKPASAGDIIRALGSGSHDQH